MIREKKITETLKLMGPPMDKKDLFDNMDSLIDSKEALEIARNKYKLKPGEGWAIGYHFTLNKVSGADVMQVFGRDISNNFTKISIDAKTKEVLSAIHKVTYDGVTYNWEILNETN